MQLQGLIAVAKEEHVVPVLRVLSRTSVSHNERIQLKISDLRYKSIKYPSRRFEAYFVTLKEIYQGLMDNTVSKKR
jgi:hypothetical protein